MVEAGLADQTVRERAIANTYENFAISIKGLVQDLASARCALGSP
jgi:hypothetical protein